MNWHSPSLTLILIILNLGEKRNLRNLKSMFGNREEFVDLMILHYH